MKNIFAVFVIFTAASCGWRADLDKKTEKDVVETSVTAETEEAVEEAEPEPDVFTIPDADIYSVEQKYLPGSAQFRVSATGKNEITVDVVTGELKDLFGLALNVVYPADLLDFSDAQFVEIFGKNNKDAVYLHANSQGNLLIGMTSLDHEKSFDVEEGKTILKLVFTAKSHGSGEIRFYKPKCVFMKNSLEKIPVDLQSVKINL